MDLLSCRICVVWAHLNEVQHYVQLNKMSLHMSISISIYLYRYTYIVKVLSHVQLFVTPWTVAHQAPLSMGFSRQEQWSGLSFPSPGDLPDLGIKPRSPALQADALTSEPTGKPIQIYIYTHYVYIFTYIHSNTIKEQARWRKERRVGTPEERVEGMRMGWTHRWVRKQPECTVFMACVVGIILHTFYIVLCIWLYIHMKYFIIRKTI